MAVPATLAESSLATSRLAAAPSSGMAFGAGGFGGAGWLGAAPSWLISAIVHLVALNVMALWNMADATLRSPQLVIAVQAAEANLAMAEDLTLIDTLETPLTLDPASEFAAAETLVADADAVWESVERQVERELFEQEMAAPTLAALTSSETAKAASKATSAAKTKANALDGTVQFYGIEARGKSFVFIVDSSRSMIGPKFESAKQELLYAVDQLSGDQSFYVIFFDSTTRRMSFQETGAPERQPAAATRDNVAKLGEWVASIPNGPWTNPSLAVHFALDLRPDAIFLLTDGDFTDRGATIKLLRERNRGAEGSPIPLHTICLQSRKGEGTLKNIAKSYGGTYRYVKTGGPDE